MRGANIRRHNASTHTRDKQLRYHTVCKNGAAKALHAIRRIRLFAEHTILIDTVIAPIRKHYWTTTQLRKHRQQTTRGTQFTD